MTTTERKLMELGLSRASGYIDLEKVLTVKKTTIQCMASGCRFGFPRMVCRGRFNRKDIAAFIDKEPGNRRYARFATEFQQPKEVTE